MTTALAVAQILAPYLIAWAVLLHFWNGRPIARCLLAALIGGAALGGLVFWDDAASGFCCREYPASFRTEWPMLVANMIIFGFIGLVPLTAAEIVRSRLQK